MILNILYSYLDKDNLYLLCLNHNLVSLFFYAIFSLIPALNHFSSTGMEEEYDYDSGYESEDYYNMYDDYGDYFSDGTEYTLRNLWYDCLVPNLIDGLSSSSKLILCSLLLRFQLSMKFLPAFAFHLSSISTGVFCLHSFFGSDILYIILFALVGYSILLLANNILKQYQGIVSVLTCFTFLIICELFFAEKTQWHRIRGSQMILTMKLISLAFDTDPTGKKMPPPIAMFGYLFHPGTVIFGPWVSYAAYINSIENQKPEVSWLLLFIRSIVLSFGFLTVSTCWTSWLFFSSSWKWIHAYRDALSFRSSHYFVCYMSEATAILSGLRYSSVVSALDIELPRSLVEVVIWWNEPMHFWLKTYVFKTARPLGTFIAVILTYAASSLLHGLNFQISAVLLSLGIYTYIEHDLRKKLSDIFKACILARRCRPHCDHLFKNNHPYVVATNICFGLLAMFHLAYLGVMFDSSSDIEEEGYSMYHTLEKWYQLGFSSHWVAVSCYIFYRLIK